MIVRLMAGESLAPNIHICASPHVSLFLILTLIRYDHSVIPPPADNSFVLQIVNNILKSNSIIITGGPHSLHIHFHVIELTSMDAGTAAAPGEAYVIRNLSQWEPQTIKGLGDSDEEVKAFVSFVLFVGADSFTRAFHIYICVRTQYFALQI